MYHETQVGAECGKHALNNLLQRGLFTVQMLNDISRRLSNNERIVLDSSQEPTVFGINGSYHIEVLVVGLIDHHFMPIRLIDMDILQLPAHTLAAAYLVTVPTANVKEGHYYSMRRFTNGGPLWILDSLRARPYIDNNHFEYLINSCGMMNYLAIYQVFDQSGQDLPAMPAEVPIPANQILTNEAVELERCSQVTRTFSTLSFNPSDEEIFSGNF